MKQRLFLTIAASLTFFAVALNANIYNETSPPSFAWHVLLRKLYSVGAFTLIGFLFTNSLRACKRRTSFIQTAAVIGAYSACIEIGQAHAGSHEGLAWNAFDIGCGALGGAIGYHGDLWLRMKKLTPRAGDESNKQTCLRWPQR
jgi:hypothetical protein